MMKVFIDVETNGTKSWKNGVVQIGLAYMEQNVLRKGSLTCNPGDWTWDDESEAAIRVSGLTKEVIQAAPQINTRYDEAGERIDGVASKVHRLLNKLSLRAERLDQELILMAWNRGFDFSFLKNSKWNMDMYRWGPCVKLTAEYAFERGLRLEEAVQLVAEKITSMDLYEDSSTVEDIKGLLEVIHDAGVDAALALIVRTWIRDRMPMFTEGIDIQEIDWPDPPVYLTPRSSS